MAEPPETWSERFVREFDALIRIARRRPIVATLFAVAMLFFGWNQFVKGKDSSLMDIFREVPASASPSVSGASSPAASTTVTPARIATVFIHIRAESRRTAAGRLKNDLERQGFFVKRIVLEESQTQPDANVIYWNPGDGGEAGSIGRTLESLGVVKPVKVLGKFGVVDVSRSYEVWL